ncbi:MAG: arginine N-succinyltransferase [bacterium]
MFRPVKERDLEPLYLLSQATQPGLTSIPKTKALWKKRIEESLTINHTSSSNKKGNWYTFVLEHKEKKEIIGTASILDSVACDNPLYVYQIQQNMMISKKLHIQQQLRKLHPKKIQKGPTELGALWLNPKYRGLGLGRFMTVARLIFICQHKKKFQSTILAEMRGYLDHKGQSPFWEHIGQKLYGIPYVIADQLAAKDRTFIEELLPKMPIIIELLPQLVQQCIGRCHPLTKAAYQILCSEGFELTRSVDVCDGGPKLIAKTNNIRVLKELKKYGIKQTKEKEARPSNKDALWVLSKGLNHKFVVQLALLQKIKNQLRINSKDVRILDLKEESDVMAIKLYIKNTQDTFNQEFWTCYQNAASLFKTIG